MFQMAITIRIRSAQNSTVLINGAAGGVGSAAVQIARDRGARVIGTASEGNHEYLRSLGAVPTTYGEGLAERLELGQLELAVAALRAPGLGVAETPLPTPQRVGTDAQHRRSRVRAHGTHGERYRAFRSFPQSPQGNLQHGRSRPIAGKCWAKATSMLGEGDV